MDAVYYSISDRFYSSYGVLSMKFIFNTKIKSCQHYTGSVAPHGWYLTIDASPPINIHISDDDPKIKPGPCKITIETED